MDMGCAYGKTGMKQDAQPFSVKTIQLQPRSDITIQLRHSHRIVGYRFIAVGIFAVGFVGRCVVQYAIHGVMILVCRIA